MKVAFVAIFGSFLFLTLLLNLYPYLGFDAASFYYGGLVIANGGTPYVDFIDNKGPAIFYLLSIPAYFYEWNTFPALVIFRIFDFLIFLLVALLLRQFVRSFWIAAIALFCFWISYLNTFASTFETIYCEMPEVICLLLAYLLAIRGGQKMIIGVLLALATLFRQPAIIHSIVILALMLASPRQGFIINTTYIKDSFKIMLGVIISMGFVAFIAWQGGWLHSWWLSTFVWPVRYMEAFPPFWNRIPTVVQYLFENDFLFAFGIGLILWIPAIFIDFLNKQYHALKSHFVLFVMLSIGVVEVSLTGKIWRHQFIPLLPALVCVLAFATNRLLCVFNEDRKMTYKILLLLIPFVISIRPAIGITTEIFNRLIFFQEREVTRQIGVWFESNTTPDDNVFIWGFAPQIYLESKRFAGVGHFHNLLLTNLEGAFNVKQDDLLSHFENDLKRRNPKYILLISGIDLLTMYPWIRDKYREGQLMTTFGGYKYLVSR